MKKLFLFSLILFSIFFSLAFVNANSVCGSVRNADNFSASWMNVLIYYPEKPSDTINCKINPENKFCCDLEEIKTVNWEKGKKVYAEVFENDLGYVGGPVSLITSEEGYDLFQEMQIQKAINFNSPLRSILINDSSLLINLSLADNYSNLNYSLNSSEGYVKGVLCNNCNNLDTYLELAKGKNTLKLTTYGQREISQEIEIYSLDYFNIDDLFQCEDCIETKQKIMIPSNVPVNLTIYFNSSHEISGNILTYFPLDWIIEDFSFVEDYSTTHKRVSKEIFGSSGEIKYSFSTPKTLVNRKDFFKYEFADFSTMKQVTVFRFLKFFPIHALKNFSDSFYFQDLLKQKVSPLEPFVLKPEVFPLETIVIYPKIKNNVAFASLNKYNVNKKDHSFNFNILTNLPESEIDKILFRFKLPKDTVLEFYDSSTSIYLQKYAEDENYDYFEAEHSKKGDFRVVLS